MNVLNITSTMFIENDLSYIRKKKSSKLMISKAVFVNIYVIANITYLGKMVIFLSSSANYLI